MKTDHSKAGGESRFLPNTAALVVHILFATVVTFLQVKILAGFLSKEVFGIFASLRGFSLLVATLAANGFPQLLVRFFPELESKWRRETAMWLYGVSLFASLGFLFIAFFSVAGMRTAFFAFMPPSELTGDLFFWFWATTFGWAFKLIVYGGLNGIRRLTVYAVLDIAALITQLAWIFIERRVLTLPVLFEITGVVSLAEAAIGALVILVFLLKSTGSGEMEHSGSLVSCLEVRRFASYWGWAVGLSVVAVAFTDVDRYLLSQVIALEMLALFHIGSRITRLANRLLGVPNLAFQPEITRINIEGRVTQTALSTRVFMKFSAVVSVFVASTLIAFAGEIIIIVANTGYMGAAPLLVILALSMPLSAMVAPLTSVMKALDKVRGALYCDLLWAVTYVCLLLALSLRFGIIGAGFAQLVACLAQLLLATKLSNLPMKLRFVATLGAMLLLCGIVAFAPLFIVEIFFGWTSLGTLTALKAAFFVFAILAFKKMVIVLQVFNLEEIRLLLDMFEKRGLGRIAMFLFGRVEA